MPSEARILANARVVLREAMSEPDPLPLKSAAALGGNAWQENLMEPLTLGPKDHGSDGLLQWRLGRLAELKRQPNWDTLPAQVRFFKLECKRDYPELWMQLVNPGARSLENLTANISKFYERPAKKYEALDKRIEYAKRVMALYDAPPAPPSVTVPPALEPVVNGPWSTLVGVLAIAYALALRSGIDPLHLAQFLNWPLLSALGGMLVFLIGGHKPASEPKLEKTVDPLVIERLISLIEALLPLLEKAAPVIEALAAHPPGGGTALSDRIADAIDRIEKLTHPQPPATGL